VTVPSLRVLISPDSLKGSLGALEAAEALAAGLREANPDAVPVVHPISDGGEGLVEVVRRVRGGREVVVSVPDPLGRPVDAGYLVLDDGTAIVESARAIGLTLLTADELDPLRASSRGLGELLGAAHRDPAVGRIVLGLGGVATVDGGAGLREALPRLSKPVTIASDVRNPLLGERGAAAVFGPQKGATPDDIPLLEARLAALDLPPDVVRRPGAGAAGGLGAMLLSMGADLVPGIDLVLELTGWHAALAGADLVITGEGSVDRSTADGKAVSGIVTAASGAGVPVVVFGGLVDPDAAADLRSRGATEVVALSGDIGSASADLFALGRRLGDPERNKRTSL
jgi:glycerate kinase